MPDPINALQNLASQGTRNNSQMMGMGGPQSAPMGGPQQMPPITASNLLQTLNRGPGQNMNVNMQVCCLLNKRLFPMRCHLVQKVIGNMYF